MNIALQRSFSFNFSSQRWIGSWSFLIWKTDYFENSWRLRTRLRSWNSVYYQLKGTNYIGGMTWIHLSSINFDKILARADRKCNNIYLLSKCFLILSTLSFHCYQISIHLSETFTEKNMSCCTFSRFFFLNMRDTDRKREHLHDWPLQFELVVWTAEALEFEIEVFESN